MAISGFGQNLSGVATLLKEHFEMPFTDAMNRNNVLLQRFKRKTGVGKEVQWKIHYAGNSSAGSYSETDDAPSAGTQSVVDASIPFRQNWVTYGVTGLANAATKGAGGFEHSLTFEAEESLKDLQNELNSQLLAFSKAASTDIDGLGVIVSDTGTYATVDRSTYTWMQSYVADNGGTPRALTIALMQDQLLELEKPARHAKVSAVMTSRKHWYDYANLLSDNRRFVNTQKLDFGVEALDFNSIPVVSVLGMANGSMFFLDESEFGYYVLENFTTTPLSVLGDAVKFMTVHYSALLCHHTGKQGRIDDLS